MCRDVRSILNGSRTAPRTPRHRKTISLIFHAASHAVCRSDFPPPLWRASSRSRVALDGIVAMAGEHDPDVADLRQRLVSVCRSLRYELDAAMMTDAPPPHRDRYVWPFYRSTVTTSKTNS